jgi:small conductance mechanosensitive channel
MLPAGLDLALPGQCADDAQICRYVVDVTDNQTAGDVADLLVGVPLVLLGLLVVFLVVRWVLHRLVDRLVRRAETGVLTTRVGRWPGSHQRSEGLSTLDAAAAASASARRVQRAKTMGDLLKSIVTGLLVAIVATMMLSEVGVDIAPIIASAGIVGVALGFGAQSLVKDFLSGIFMIVEDQFGVGDVIDVGEATGTVEAVSFRVTRLRDINGTVWYVPNGSILRVGNQSQNWSQTVLDIGVAYDEDLARVKAVLADVAHDLWDDEDFKGTVIQEPTVWGVQDLAPDQVTVRVVLKTTAGDQFAVAREMRERIKARFDHEGIEIPFPQRVVWQRTEPGPAGAGDPRPATAGAGGDGKMEP